VAELARDELADITRLTPMINTIEQRLAKQVRCGAPSLLALHGCGVLTAARIIGEAADVDRFATEAAFARYAGLAPIPDWSGGTRGRVRSYRGGNRQLNAALHQIAMTQIKKGAPSESYYRRRRAGRDSHAHAYALNGVKRRIARTVFTRLRADRRDVPLAPFIAELDRHAERWAALIGPPAPATATRRQGRRAHRADTTTALWLGEVADITRRWAAELAAPGRPGAPSPE
jgi:hypothetical protein